MKSSCSNKKKQETVSFKIPSELRLQIVNNYVNRGKPMTEWLEDLLFKAENAEKYTPEFVKKIENKILFLKEYEMIFGKIDMSNFLSDKAKERLNLLSEKTKLDKIKIINKLIEEL